MNEMIGSTIDNSRALSFRLLTTLLGSAALLWVLTAQGGNSWPLASTILLASLAFASERYPLTLPGYGVVSGLESCVIATLCLGQTQAAAFVLLVGVISRACLLYTSDAADE